jgi:o-succinylbenzoate synthase
VTLALSLAKIVRTLSRPALNARQSWSSRAACIVTLTSDSGTRGSGEAAPLPGFGLDTVEACQRALTAFDARGIPERLEPKHAVLDELARASARLPEAVPAARAALEGALLDLWSRAAHKPAWALLVDARAPLPEPRSLVALLMGDPEQALAQARTAHARGLRSFKFKIGRIGALDRELLAVRDLRAELGTEVKIRLDANGSFNAAQAQECLPRFTQHDVEFVEEPCPNTDLPQLADVEFPLALDESLLHLNPNLVNDLQRPTVRALILKPTLLGGISACHVWANAAARIGAQVILSHSFEGPLGLALSAALALSIGSTTSAHGLDPDGARLEHLNGPFSSNGQLEAWSAPGFGEFGVSK